MQFPWKFSYLYLVIHSTLVAFGVQKAQIAYHEMDGNLFAKYIEEKANPIIGVLEQNMYIGKFDWAQCSAPTGNDIIVFMNIK